MIQSSIAHRRAPLLAGAIDGPAGEWSKSMDKQT
jgi:hypothetical protein